MSPWLRPTSNYGHTRSFVTDRALFRRKRRGAIPTRITDGNLGLGWISAVLSVLPEKRLFGGSSRVQTPAGPILRAFK